ncbi:glycosyltransferase [Bacteroidales bacterium SW292]|mgnify:CR=1 FL=1|nr:glycosyltransferase [Bacteroidales bacterium SW292]
MKRILYILKHDPWGIGGGCYVCRMYLTAFRKIFPKHAFDVCICQECLSHQPEAWKKVCNFIPVPPRGELSRMTSIFTGVMHRHQQTALRLIRENEYEYCIFDHSNLAGTLCTFLKSNTKSIVIHHNHEPNYFKDNTTSWLYRKLFMHYVKSTERDAYLKCTYNLFLTEEDESLFRRVYGKPSGKSTHIGIFDLNDNISRRLVQISTSENIVVITGSLNNVQNVDGILYFIKELYPLIAGKCKIIIAGKDPTQAVCNATKNHADIKLIPNPKDMNDILSRGNIFICPTRLGGGIKVRISDGLRSGLPVIAQSVSARGYGDFIAKGYFYSYETPVGFLEQFNRLISDKNNKKFTPEEIAEFFQLNNSFSAGIEKLKQLFLL